MNILFVERDRATRRLVKDMLVQAGATLIEIGGTAGLRSIGDALPSLAIVEVEGEAEGVAAIVRLHGWGAGRPTILALAAEPGLAEPARAAGADEVLVEPAPLTELFDAIARHLPATDA